MRRGLVPDGGGAWLLPRLVGVHRAKELLLLGDALGRPRPQALGLVNRVVPPTTTSPTPPPSSAERLAEGPTRRAGPHQGPVNALAHVDRATGFARRGRAQELNMATADAQEGVAAFVERRDPDYLGW